MAYRESNVVRALDEGKRAQAEAAWRRFMNLNNTWRNPDADRLFRRTVAFLKDAGMNPDEAEDVVTWAEEEECSLATALDAWAKQ